MPKKKCYNCKYASQRFNAFGLTHHHCQKPEYEEQANAGDPPSAWETLREWWDTCETHQFKSKLKDK